MRLPFLVCKVKTIIPRPGTGQGGDLMNSACRCWHRAWHRAGAPFCYHPPCPWALYKPLPSQKPTAPPSPPSCSPTVSALNAGTPPFWALWLSLLLEGRGGVRLALSYMLFPSSLPDHQFWDNSPLSETLLPISFFAFPSHRLPPSLVFSTSCSANVMKC